MSNGPLEPDAGLTSEAKGEASEAVDANPALDHYEGLLHAEMELDSYRVIDRLGEGGMGHVYAALHTGLGRKVAIKQLHPRYANDREVVQRFFSEARAVSQISHDHLVQITDFISQGDTHCYVMELLEGESLGERLKSQGRIPVPRALWIAEQVCAVLDAVHSAGIVHRDMKPDNIFLSDRNGDPDYVKLIDFGVAKFAADHSLDTPTNITNTGLRLGTPGYIAPEYAIQGNIDHRVDLYALGVILFEMVTGRRPFQGDTWPQLLIKHAQEAPPRPSTLAMVPPPLEELILSCMEKEPQNRPQTAQVLAAQLREIVRQLGYDSNPALLSTPAAVAGISPPRRTSLWVAVGAAALFAVGGGLAAFYFTHAAQQAASPEARSASRPEDVPVAPPPKPVKAPAAESSRANEAEAKISAPREAPARHRRRPARRRKARTKPAKDEFFDKLTERKSTRSRSTTDAFFDDLEK